MSKFLRLKPESGAARGRWQYSDPDCIRNKRILNKLLNESPEVEVTRIVFTKV
jgi:hypothetical protein